jgi:uncharacterized protein YndB with AHSA1/START domain
MTKWLPPNGFAAKVHHMDAKVGGAYKMSFTNFKTGANFSFGGEYRELISNERLCYTDVFEIPNMADEILVTINLRKVSVGTEINIAHELRSTSFLVTAPKCA